MSMQLNLGRTLVMGWSEHAGYFSYQECEVEHCREEDTLGALTVSGTMLNRHSVQIVYLGLTPVRCDQTRISYDSF